jgi:hypothetical protein
MAMPAHVTKRGSNGKLPRTLTSPTKPQSSLNQHLEQTLETSLKMHLWYPHQSTASTSTLSKTPILRDVPQMKRKLTTRMDRELTTSIVTDTRPFQSLKSAAPSWLREKPSRQKLTTSLKPLNHTRGTWKRVTAVCRDNGVLIIFGEDRAMVHSISIKELSATDIRIVDDSLFTFPNVLGIFC